MFKNNFLLAWDVHSCLPQHYASTQNGIHPKIFAQIGVGCGKKWLSEYKNSDISETRQVAIAIEE